MCSPSFESFKDTVTMGFYWFDHPIPHLIMDMENSSGKLLVDRIANNYLLTYRCHRKLIYYIKNPAPFYACPFF